MALALRTSGLFGFHCTIFLRRYSAYGVKNGEVIILNAVGIFGFVWRLIRSRKPH
jgi:hypothetical protein